MLNSIYCFYKLSLITFIVVSYFADCRPFFSATVFAKLFQQDPFGRLVGIEVKYLLLVTQWRECSISLGSKSHKTI